MHEEVRVVVADDSPLVRSILREQLEQQGFRVFEAGDGQQALELAMTAAPDVVLLDYQMPVLDGRDVLTRLKANPDTAHVPVVFLTAHGSTDEVVATLQLGAHDYLRKPFDQTELLARISAAVRVKRLTDELSRLARVDVLTGLYNRRHLLDQLDALSASSRRRGEPLAVLLLDVDNFKNFNDQHGHAVGDAVLRTVGQRIADSVRAEDVVGRWGGEEFLILLPMTGLDGACVTAGRILDAVRESAVDSPAGDLRITASIGVAAHTGEAPEVQLRHADSALYRAKSEGRDRFASWSAPAPQ